MNERELQANRQATAYVVHDLNAWPTMPFPDDRFDAATCCVSIDYLVRPIDVLREVARVVKPHGTVVLHLLEPVLPDQGRSEGVARDQRAAALPRRRPVLPAHRSPTHEPQAALCTPADTPGDPLYAVWAMVREPKSTRRRTRRRRRDRRSGSDAQAERDQPIGRADREHRVGGEPDEHRRADRPARATRTPTSASSDRSRRSRTRGGAGRSPRRTAISPGASPRHVGFHVGADECRVACRRRRTGAGTRRRGPDSSCRTGGARTPARVRRRSEAVTHLHPSIGAGADARIGGVAEEREALAVRRGHRREREDAGRGRPVAAAALDERPHAVAADPRFHRRATPPTRSRARGDLERHRRVGPRRAAHDHLHRRPAVP